VRECLDRHISVDERDVEFAEPRRITDDFDLGDPDRVQREGLRNHRRVTRKKGVGDLALLNEIGVGRAAASCRVASGERRRSARSPRTARRTCRAARRQSVPPASACRGRRAARGPTESARSASSSALLPILPVATGSDASGVNGSSTGVAGFGASSVIHTASLVELSTDLPRFDRGG
jgi:hypothetical protein